MKENSKIPVWKKICYGCGAGGGNVMSTLLATFLTAYYTDTAGNCQRQRLERCLSSAVYWTVLQTL